MARRIVAALLIIVATVLAPVAITGLWAQRTLTDTQLFVETVAPLADDPQVRQTVSTEVSSALVEAVDAKTRLQEAVGNFDGPVAQLVDNDVILNSIASGINGAIESGVQQYTQSDRFGDAWLAITTKLQEGLVAMINRDTSNAAVTLQEGQIVLDTKVAAEKVQAELVAKGVPFADQLDRVPGRDLVLADTPRLQTAADVLHIALPVASWLWWVVMGLFLVGALLWPRRARGFMWAGLGLLLAGGVTYLVLGIGEDQVVGSAPSAYTGVMTSLLSVLLRFLANALLVMVCVGAAFLVAGWLAGGANSGRRVRQMVTDPIHRWSTPLADTWLGRFTGQHPMLVPTLRAIVVALGIGYLFAAARLTPGQVLWTAVAVIVGLLVVEVVEGSGLGFEKAHAGALVAEAPHPTPE